MEGVIKELKFYKQSPWKDKMFFNYNAVVEVNGSDIKGSISTYNEETTLAEGDKISFTLSETTYGNKFEKPFLIKTLSPVVETLFEKGKPVGVKEHDSRLDMLKIESMRLSVQYWENKKCKPEDVVLTAKYFYEHLIADSDYSTDLPF